MADESSVNAKPYQSPPETFYLGKPRIHLQVELRNRVGDNFRCRTFQLPSNSAFQVSAFENGCGLWQVELFQTTRNPSLTKTCRFQFCRRASELSLTI
jgi:hypothetical protein